LRAVNFPISLISYYKSYRGAISRLLIAAGIAYNADKEETAQQDRYSLIGDQGNRQHDAAGVKTENTLTKRETRYNATSR
jgi:hypothetical protein